MTQQDPATFEGEEPGAGHAAPALDLIAAAFLFALSVVVMVASLRLPVPGEIRTAPGLLPFLIAASLCLMALALAASAWSRRGQAASLPAAPRDRGQDRRTLLLAGAVALYILALQLLAFQVFFSVHGIPFVLSAFEPVTVLALAAIIHIFWRGPLWITVLISAGWTLALSLTFQKLFTLPLPGGF